MVRPVGRIHNYTYAAYLEHESSSNVKHEFLDGEIYGMAGRTLQHAVLAMNVGASLVAQLRGQPCVVASSDLKVRVMSTGLATYPDASVICGEIERDPLSRDVVLNPTVLIEVLSDSTEELDRGEKLEHYKRIAALKECVIVSHRARCIDVIRREDDGTWSARSSGSGEIATLVALRCTLSVDDMYRNVDIPS
jgi:Uma2 family endonuclease